jgi:autotransporter passenger strand-loop-strand repeat protein
MVLSGGLQVVFAGGQVSGALISSGGTQALLGGMASATTIAAGGSSYVSSGSADNGALVTGEETVLSGGLASSTVVSSGGQQLVQAGGSAVSATVFGGQQNVSSGGTTMSTTVNFRGKQNVLSGGTAIGTTVSSGGQQEVFLGGATTSAIIDSLGRQDINLGGSATGTTVNFNGVQFVHSGGIATGTTINSGGSQSVDAGGTATSATANSGGYQTVNSGGVASSTIVNSDGGQVISSGGMASGATVNAGGRQAILGGGVASSTIINSGGLQYVDGVVQGYAYNAVVNSGGTQEVAFGGYASGTVVSAGGAQQVDSAGSAVATTVAGGAQLVLSGGSATTTLVSLGGLQNIEAGGYASGTTVSSGTVLVNGTGANLTLLDGSTVTGTGMIASDLPVGSGATLLASTLGAGLTVNGTLTLGGGSNYSVVVNAAGLSGVTSVLGNVVIANGAVLNVSANPGSYSAGTAYKIVTYTGTQSGTFTTVNADFAYLTPSVAYTGGAIVVTLNAAPSFTSVGFAAAASTQNQINVASALTSIYNAGGNALTATLIGASSGQASDALTQLAGDEAVVFRQTAARRTGQMQGAVAQRLADSSGALASAAGSGQDMWVSADYSHSHEGGEGGLGSGAYGDNSARVTLGYDRAVSPTVRAGAALAVNNDTLQFSDRAAHARSDGVQAVLYGGWRPQAGLFYVNGMVGVGYWDNAQSRTVAVGSLSGTANGVFHTSALAAYLESGLKVGVPYGIWQPYLGLRAGHYTQGGFAESGGGAIDLAYSAASSNALSSVLGVRFTRRAGAVRGKSIDLQAELAWEHRFGGMSQSLNAAFVDAPAATYQVFGTPSSRDTASMSVGAQWHWSELTTLYARVSADAGANEHDYGVTVSAQWKW